METGKIRVALISLCRTAADSSGDYCGLFPIGNDTLLAYQIGLAARAGAQKLLCHVDTVPGDLMRHERLARDLGLEWVTIRQFGDLLAHLMDDDSLLVIGDSMYHSLSVFDDFLGNNGAAVLLAPADDAITGMERLDLNHLWAGLLHIRRDQLDGLSEVPADWSLESVLLRAAMKTEIRNAVIPARTLDRRAVTPIEMMDDSQAVSLDLLNPETMQDHPLSNYLLRALASVSALSLWRRQQRTMWLAAGGIILLLALLVFMAWSWSIAGIVCGYTGYLCSNLARAVDQPARRINPIVTSGFITALAGCGAIMLLLVPGTPPPIAGYIALIWLIMQGLLIRMPDMPIWRQSAFDPLLLSALALLTAISGPLYPAIALLTLVQAACLLLHNVRKG